MSQLDKTPPPKIKNRSSSSSVLGDLWHKCPSCSTAVYSTGLRQNNEVCPKRNHRNPPSARERLNLLLDKEGREEVVTNTKPTDPLKFKDSKKYSDRLAAVCKATGEDGALVAMKGTMNGLPVVAAAFKLRLTGSSIGSIVGERFVQGVRRAVANNCSSICVTTPGSARIQKGVNFLIQMTEASAALHLLTERRLPFTSVLTDSTMGSVLTSPVFLGDIVLAGPNVLIGFADPRAIEQAVHETLPEGFQRAEFLLGKGATDQIVDRRSMEKRISNLTTLLRHEDKVIAAWWV